MKNTSKINEQKIAYYEEVTKRKWHKNATVLDCSFSRLTEKLATLQRILF